MDNDFSSKFPIPAKVGCKYKSRNMPTKVIIVGAGGTGARLVPLVAQMMASIPWLNSFKPPKIILVDDDVVEVSNLLRQLFIEEDVGEFKSDVIAKRYSAAFGVDILPVIKRLPINSMEEKIESGLYEACVPSSRYSASSLVKQGKGNYRYDFSRPVWVLAVDTVDARRKILKMIWEIEQEYLSYTSPAQLVTSFDRETNVAVPPLILDAGNEDTFGQIKATTIGSYINPFRISTVIGGDDLAALFKEEPEKLDIISSSWLLNLLKMASFRVVLPFIPFNTREYNNMVPGVSTGTCADLPQTLGVNALMATGIFAFIQSICFNHPLIKSVVRLTLSGDNTSEIYNLTDYQDKNGPYSWKGNRNPKEDDNIIPLSEMLDYYRVTNKSETGGGSSNHRIPAFVGMDTLVVKAGFIPELNLALTQAVLAEKTVPNFGATQDSPVNISIIMGEDICFHLFHLSVVSGIDLMVPNIYINALKDAVVKLNEGRSVTLPANKVAAVLQSKFGDFVQIIKRLNYSMLVQTASVLRLRKREDAPEDVLLEIREKVAGMLRGERVIEPSETSMLRKPLLELLREGALFTGEYTN